MRFWNGPQLLVIDELGYLPMPGEAASHLFQVITRRYEHGSIILTTNRGIADWGKIFEDTTVAVAILDRLLHHATVLQIDGESYRMRGHRARLNNYAPASTSLGKTRDRNWGIPMIVDNMVTGGRPGETFALDQRDDITATAFDGDECACVQHQHQAAPRPCCARPG